MNAALISRFVDLYSQCQRQHCRIRHGHLPFSLVEWEVLPRACCLTIYYDRYLAEHDTAQSDHSELIQSSYHSLKQPHAGLDLPTSQDKREPFQFNPNAPAFIPNVPAPRPPPARWRELHQHWLRLAFSWQGEVATVTFTTWFVNQHNPALRRCTQSRPVSLSEDFRQWDDAFRRAWPDRALAGAPFMIHVVTPQPPNFSGAANVHLILVQTRKTHSPQVWSLAMMMHTEMMDHLSNLRSLRTNNFSSII